MSSGDCVPPASQIPGLSNVPADNEDEKRKHYIRETDSEYIKLAKQGGTKGLLSIQSNEEHKEAVDYPKSEWFGHHAMDQDDQKKILSERHWKAPDYMTHSAKPVAVQSMQSSDAPAKPRDLTAREERLLIQAKYNNREVPFQSDNLSCWERKDDPPRRNKI